MATLKAKVFKEDRKSDGTYNVKIHIIHKRSSTKVGTTINATSEDLTRNLKIKNRIYLESLDKIIKRWSGYVAKLDGAADSYTAAELAKYCKALDKKMFNPEPEPEPEVFRLDFIKHGFDVAATKSESTEKNYVVALNALQRFLQSRGQMSLDVSEVKAKLLREFEAFLRSEPTLCYSPAKGVVSTGKPKAGRAFSLYMAHLRHIFNEAKRLYNEEDEEPKIKHSPFDHYKVVRTPRKKPRAIDVKLVQQIIDLPNHIVKDGPPVSVPRRDLVRDCFLLSFGLAGMNAADLFYCPIEAYDEERQIIVYNRKKICNRRDDRGEMHIRIEPCIKPLFEKYRDYGGEHLFKFSSRYSSHDGFNVALRLGLLQIEKELKVKHFTFYSGRHTWATIGRSKAVKIDKSTIHEGLNHVEEGMQTTDIYIDKDYELVWDANAEILAQLDWSALLEREKKYVKEVAAEVV